MVKKILGEILIKELADPKMGLVTITDVEVSTDLRSARVYYSIVGGSRELRVQKEIVENMHKMFRVKLAARIVLKYIPRLDMVFDETPRHAQKIEKLLKDIRTDDSEKITD